MRTFHYFSPWLKSLKKYQPVWAQIKSALTAENEIYDFVILLFDKTYVTADQ